MLTLVTFSTSQRKQYVRGYDQSNRRVDIQQDTSKEMRSLATVCNMLCRRVPLPSTLARIIKMKYMLKNNSRRKTQLAYMFVIKFSFAKMQ